MKNPFNPITEPSSYQFYEDKYPIKNIDDDNTDYNLVKIKNKTPHCIIHGAMNKVSAYENGGYWRCLQGLCRAGCEQLKNLN